MKFSKTYQYIHLLNYSEKRILKTRIKNEKQLSIYEYLCNESSIPEAESDAKHEMLSFYPKPHTPKTEALLRSDLRHVTNKVRQFILEIQFNKNASEENYLNDSLLLDFIEQRQSITLFQNEAKNIIQKAELRGDLRSYNACMLRLLKLQGQINQFQEKEFLSVYEQSRQLEKMIIDECSLQFRVYEVLIAGLHSILKERFSIHSQFEAPENKYQIELTDAQPIVKSKWILFQLYLCSPEKKLPLIHELIDVLESNHLSEYNVSILVHARNLEALELYKQNKLIEAEIAYRQLLQQQKEIPKAWMPIITYNFSTLLMRMGKYEEALQFLDKSDQHVTKEVLSSIKGLCLVLMNRHTEAEEHLPESEQGLSRETIFYIRFIRAVVYYRRGDLELAENALINLLQNVYYKSHSDSSIQDLVKLFLQLLKVQNIPSKSEKTKALKELSSKVSMYLSSESENYRSNSMIADWLRMEIANQ